MTLSSIGGPGSQPQAIRKPTPQEQEKANETLGEIAGSTAAGAVVGSIVPGLGTALGAAAGFAFGVVSNVVEGAIESLSGEGQAAPPGSDFEAPAFDQGRYDAIAQMYRDILGREPDPGIQGWMESGKPLDQVRSEIADSPEARTNAIAQMYRDILGREPDPGIQGWVESGKPLDQVRSEIASSPEAQVKAAAAGAAALLAKQEVQKTTQETVNPVVTQKQAAQLKQFKDFLLTRSDFRMGVNVATDAKYDDPKIQFAVKEFYEAGLEKGLSVDAIEKAVTKFDEAFKSWTQDTGTARPVPADFLLHRYHQSAF